MKQCKLNVALATIACLSPLRMKEQELKKLVSKHPKTQEGIAADLGIGRSTLTNWISGRRKISPSDEKLLRLYFYGEIPFDMIRDEAETDLSSVLEFSASEWAVIELLSRRSGYHTPGEWIVANIREYLAFRETQDGAGELSLVADDTGEYGQRCALPCAAVAAGHPISGDDLESVTLSRSYGLEYLAFLVCGPSMEPEIEDGAVIVGLKFENFRVQQPKKGLIYVFSLGGELTLKRYNTRSATAEEIAREEDYIYISPRDGSLKVKVLQSANPDYEEIIVRGEVEIVAWYDAGNQP